MFNPNNVEVKFWKGESLEDYGFVLQSDAEGYNGNIPALYGTGPDGHKWRFDNCFHLWIETK